MNYVILNGQKSTEIKGLLIQALPPISKPLMRTEIEEIDGRPGDIVTKLGYAAYDKPVTIGLYGDYDIDEVIAYFDSEGIVTFSNEIDKYYRYTIIDQIDFERLIRFRVATVTFHVQPFKFSTVEKAKTFSVNTNLLSVPNFSKTANGVTVSATDGVITVSGTATKATEIYMPITPLKLAQGNYTLTANAAGTNPGLCSMRLIGEVPSNADTFSGNYFTLKNGPVSVDGALDSAKTFNYLWFYISAGSMNITATFTMQSEVHNFQIRNSGNTTARPILTVYGQDNIILALNGHQAFEIDLADEEFITIDTAAMEAYKGGVLKNRSVSGDYDNFALKVGLNTISWTGSMTAITLENYSRWL